ncbi:hypothetical protein [Nostoc sp. UHCC 0251]|uniref:hypothetical protein n=1 Tax=Nostoc sp. UHCC 0251 TaxID=3110240 RepID=UPI002B2040A9|nr:hypothetical protein [Nostoc sp. UHCC 0251]MEA5628172.1 hypothetical protein [Nostoc sp. UHCC 0251]
MLIIRVLGQEGNKGVGEWARGRGVFGVIGLAIAGEFIRRSLLERFIVSIIMKNFQQWVKRKWILGFLGIVLFQNYE